MESGVNKKLRVVWICHFSNEHIQKKLNTKHKIPEFAPWISIGIQEAKKRKDIELHIISPHKWINKSILFSEGNIYHYFFSTGIPLYGRHWPAFFRFDIYTNFLFNKLKVKRFINKIKPDIIHLHGIENAYYSCTAKQFRGRYPIINTIQGFISLQANSINANKDVKKRIDIEQEILRSESNFGVRTGVMRNEILKHNKNAHFYWHEYFLNTPSTENITPSSTKKDYDLVFFARVSKAKGVEDLIKVTGLLKEQFKDIKAAIIGGASDNYIATLKKLAEENKCTENIQFLGFLPKQEDVYKILMKSKICVMPTYNDVIPGTIIESMLRRIPVVAYKTGGIPEINKEEEIIPLVEQGDIKNLGKQIEQLLKDNTERAKKAEKAYNYASNRWNNKKALSDIIDSYKEIIAYGNTK